jgi:pimeloyl-ACP methyl ester carboxylesterase
MQFAAFDQDAIDDQQFLARGKLPVPVRALVGKKSFGTTMAKIMHSAVSSVREGVIPDSCHWIMEENPTATISMVRAFLDADT